MTPQIWQEKCAEIKARHGAAAASAATLADLEKAETECLGRKGELTELLKTLKDFPLEDKKRLGPAGNALKEELAGLFAGRRDSLSRAELDARLSSVAEDLTLPPYPFPKGHRHPLTVITDSMTGILMRMGFAWADGPYIENEHHNFDALNVVPHHPARDMHDTFYVRPAAGHEADERLLLRTHTSSVQIRYMRGRKPPVRIISPGRAFRSDRIDASHSPVFHQLEGLCVDEGVSLADLKTTLTQFYTALFRQKVDIRFRPSYFPFVEPGVEVDFSCVFCKGKGCPVCKRSGWVEVGGAGVVHPNVLKAVGIDPEKYGGYAFGLGIERTAMLLYGINDIRAFYENDLRVLSQF